VQYASLRCWIRLWVNFNMHSQPISAKSQERIEPDRKPSNGHHCNPHPVREHFAPGSNWRTSQDLYNTIHGARGHLAAKLQQEENRVAALQSSQEIACAMSPVGSECSSATGTLNKLNAKIAQLHDRYDRCVLHDLRHNAAVYPRVPKVRGSRPETSETLYSASSSC